MATTDPKILQFPTQPQTPPAAVPEVAFSDTAGIPDGPYKERALDEQAKILALYAGFARHHWTPPDYQEWIVPSGQLAAFATLIDEGVLERSEAAWRVLREQARLLEREFAEAITRADMRGITPSSTAGRSGLL